MFSHKYLPDKMFEGTIRRNLQDEIESGFIVGRPFEFDGQRVGVLARHILFEAEPIDEFFVVGS